MASRKPSPRRKPPPRVCPQCQTPRPDYNGRLKFPAPCPSCKSTAPPVKGSRPRQPQKKKDEKPLTPEVLQTTTKKAPIVDLKADFTEQELQFLNIYLAGGVAVNNAMIQAGYTNLSESMLFYLGNRIVQKRVEQAGEIKNLMRSCGLSEIQVIQKIKELMENPSATIRARATELAAKILEMTKESVASALLGVQIVIKQDGAQPVQVAAGPSPAPAEALPDAPKVRMIK